MKNLLVLAYYFPPCGTIGGLRTLKFCRYLPEAGWRPLVLAGTFPGADGYGHDEADLARVRAAGELLRLPGSAPAAVGALPPWARRLGRLALSPRWATDTQFSWGKAAFVPALDWIRREKPAAILATFTPVGALTLALALKKETGLPVVFDFRDAWTSNPGMPYVAPWQKAYERRWERRLLPQADLVLAATGSIAADLRAAGAARVEVLPNGYDEAAFEGPEPELPRDLWRLTYVGHFYGDMSLGAAAAGMAALAAARPDLRARLRLRVVGALPDAQRRAVAQAGFSGSLEVTGPVSHAEAVREMRASHALLQLLWTGSASVHSTKTFEYLRSGRPILGLAPEGESRKLLEARAHPVLGLRPSPEEVRDALLPWVDRVPATRLPDPDLARFARRAQALTLAAHLEHLA